MINRGKKNIVMIAYSNYMTDARIRREAETLASTQEYEVTVLALKKGKRERLYTNGGVIVQELSTSKYQGKILFRYLLSYLKFMLEAFRLCNRLYFKGKVWAFHVHNLPNFLILAAIIPRILGGKLILDIHDSVPETYAAKFGNLSRGLLFRLLCLEEAMCCKLANRIICVNHVQKDVLIRRGLDPSKTSISMNVPDPKIFNQQDSDKSGDKGGRGFKLVYHGTLAKRLGIDLTIKAVARLINKIPGLEFYVLGCGDDQEEFKGLAKALGVDQFVHFAGMTPLEELTRILKGMDLGIMANRKNVATELMLPVKMIELIALGVPVVAPRLKAIEYYFNEEMVSYFEPENVDSLANSILALFRDGTRREKQVQKAKGFLEQYGWEIHQCALLDLYMHL